MYAARNGHLESVKVLLEASANVNAKSSDGKTALMLAAWNRHLEIVQLLVEKGADYENVKDESFIKRSLEKTQRRLVHRVFEDG